MLMVHDLGTNSTHHPPPSHICCDGEWRKIQSEGAKASQEEITDAEEEETVHRSQNWLKISEGNIKLGS